jgi:hypothetical protein
MMLKLKWYYALNTNVTTNSPTLSSYLSSSLSATTLLPWYVAAATFVSPLREWHMDLSPSPSSHSLHLLPLSHPTLPCEGWQSRHNRSSVTNTLSRHGGCPQIATRRDMSGVQRYTMLRSTPRTTTRLSSEVLFPIPCN